MNPLGTRIGEISGQVVYLASGFNNVITTVTTNISGQTVKAEISGQTVVGNFAADVSGNKIRLQAFDPSGNTWRDLIVNQSGGNKLFVDAGSISVSSNISGQVVYLTSGQNSVQISGQPISIIGTVPVSIAATVTVAGTVSTNVSGNTIRNQFFDPSGAVWRDAWVERSGGNRLLVTNSGDSVNIGNTVTIQGAVTTSVSGNVITIGSQPISVTTSVSGNYISTSGSAVVISGQRVQTSGDAAIISGQPVGTSGQMMRAQFFDPSGAIWRDAWVERSGGNRLLVTNSGDSVVVSNTVAVTLPTNPISGQTVVSQISGQTITVGNASLAVTTSVSGNYVSTSGSAVVISGQRVQTSGDAAVISGQPVGTSGQMQRVQAFDPSGQTWQDLWVSQSGGHDLRVNASVQATADISGQTVKAEVSGQKIRLQGFDPSGNTWNDLIVNASGSNVLRVDAGAIQVAANVSGNVVYLTSGQNSVQNSGQQIRAQMFDPSGATWRDLWTERSGGNRLLVTNSGDSVVVSNTVTIQGTVTTSVSGNNVAVLMSGGSMSGLRVSTSGDAVVISGQRVAVSGEKIRLQGFDPSGNTWNDLIVNASGSNILRVDVGSIQVSSNVSGNVVYLTSGQNETLALNRAFDPSGAVWRDLWVERSGGNRLLVTASGDAYTISNTVTIQGAVTTSISGNNVVVLMSGGSMSGLNVITSGGAAVISGQPVNISGSIIHNQAFDPSGANWRDLWVERSGGNRLLATISGDSVNIGNTVAVTTSVSGNYVTVSGSAVVISGQIVNVSGAAVVISGQIVNVSGAAVVVSGQPVKDHFWTAVRVPVTKQITSASGGATLDSGIAQMVTLRNIGQSGTIMYVGYSGVNNAPFVQAERSGRGFQLKDGDSITIPVPQYSGNMELIRVVSLTSGQEISYMAIGYNG